MPMSNRTTQLVYFGVPTISFIAIRMLAGGPQSVNASDTFSAEPEPALPTLVFEEDPNLDRDAQDVCVEIRGHLSPFWHDDITLVDEPYIELPIDFDPNDQGAEQVFAVSSILPHPTRPLAVINGKPYKIGDRVASGWTLTLIDGDTRSIVIKNASGVNKRISISDRH